MDREKVINGLREMSCRATWKDIDRIRHKFQPIINDALSLLKEQEAVKPTWSCGKPFCGACGLRIHDGQFCSKCGKPILWGGR